MISFISPSSAATLINTLATNRKDFLFAFDYELTKAFVITNPLSQKDIFFSVPSYTNDEIKENLVCKLTALKTDYKDYARGFDIIQKALLRGDTYLANYTVRTPIKINFPLKEIFRCVQSPFKLYVPGQFVCFSPERFVKIHNNLISTFPMKGTIDATIPDAEKIILNDRKETAEHVTVVDLLRNDIGMVANKVNVTRFRYIDKITSPYNSILQVSSEITGTLATNWQDHLGDIILKLLPAGSICGAPKQSTLKAISEAENSKRGFYTGVFGYFDGESLDSAVLIRFIEQEKEKYFFRSGGGITVNSECEKEYREVNQKIYLPCY